MTTPLDRDLAERLGRLAGAVPVGTGQLDPVHANAVAARHRVRMAWLTPLVAVVVLALVAGVMGIGPFNLLSQSVSTTKRNGDFELTISSPKGTWVSGQPIEISVSLVYVGPEPSVTISHAHSPFMFGMKEPVHGLFLNGVELDSRGRTVLQRGVALEEPWQKSFATIGPLTPEAEAFAREPGLVLPPGTWHPSVIAKFSPGDGSGPASSIEADLEIVVTGPAPSVAPTDAGVQSSTLADDFELGLVAAKTTFASDKGIDIDARLTYHGPDASTSIAYGAAGLLSYSIGGVAFDRPTATRGCVVGQLVRDEAQVAALADLPGGPKPFRLPHGRYEITVIATFDRDTCSPKPWTIQTTIAIVVTDGPDDIPLWTNWIAADVCELRGNTGSLVRDPESGLAVRLPSGARKTIWPGGYSARLNDGVAELVAPNGAVVAHEGDVLRFAGGFPDGAPIAPCGRIEVATPSAVKPSATTAPDPTLGDDGPIDLATASAPAASGSAGACEVPLLVGTLELNPQTGLGLLMNGEHQPVRWPFGYTASRKAGDVVLRDGEGLFVARLGQSISFGQVSYVGNVLVPCTKVRGIVLLPASS